MLRASLGLGLLLAGAAAGVEVRVMFTKSRGNNPDGLSLSEVRFLHEATQLPVTAASNPGGVYSANEGPEDLIDGYTQGGSKWVDTNFTTQGYSMVVFEVDDTLGAPNVMEVVAPNNPTGRWPVSWTVEIADICGGFTEVASVSDTGVTGTAYWSNYEDGPFDLGAAPSLTAEDCEKTSAVRFIFTELRGGSGTDAVMLSEVRTPAVGPSPELASLPPPPPPPPPPRARPPRPARTAHRLRIRAPVPSSPRPLPRLSCTTPRAT